MPEIIGIDDNEDSIEVEVRKDQSGVDAGGRIYAYPSKAAAENHGSPDDEAHHVGDWFSPASSNVVGKGSIGLEHRGKWLMVDQRSGSTAPKWCTKPYRAGIVIA